MSNPSDRSRAATQAGGARPATPRPEGRKSERPSMRPGGPESLIGTVLSGRYRIERLLGEGGMGAVYQAQHTHMHKRLAVKVLHPEMSRLPEVVARFEREAMAAAHIEHPNVAAATDFGKLEDGSFFLVLEHVEGKSLRDAISEGRLELGRALHVMRQIAGALARAHTLGIVHRDLKPENVMLVARDADPDFVKVLDFGIAKVPVGELMGDGKASGQALTQLGMVYGTPEYMAPEQALGQDVDARADLYALGVLTFEMISGTRPYQHESKVSLLGMHVTAPIPRMAERAPEANVPPEVDALVTRLLAKEAAARFADARALIDAIDAVAAQLVAGGRISEPMAPASSASPSLLDPNASGARAALALGPTNVAQPLPRGSLPSLPSLGARGPLASIASLRDLMPPRVRALPPRTLAIAGGAAGVLLLLLVVIAVASSGSRSSARPAGSASAGATYAPLVEAPPDSSADEVVVASQAKIEKGDFASAIDALANVEKKYPERPDVHALLERAYTGARNGAAAMREAGLWLGADANAAADLKLQEDIRNAALVQATQDEAFTLLESRMGTRGVDILYDIAYGASGRMYPQAASRAKRSLEGPDVRERASPALGVLLAFRDAKSCDQKHDMLDDVKDKADARIVPVLQPYQAARGCGFLGRSDCYPCMHRDHALQETLAAINERASKAP